MTLHEYVLFDPRFSDAAASGIVRLCERFGGYGMYSAENEGGSEIGDGLTQRHDAVLNYLKAGGMRGAGEPVSVLAARTNYFRDAWRAHTDDLCSTPRWRPSSRTCARAVASRGTRRCRASWRP